MDGSQGSISEEVITGSAGVLAAAARHALGRPGRPRVTRYDRGFLEPAGFQQTASIYADGLLLADGGPREMRLVATRPARSADTVAAALGGSADRCELLMNSILG